MSNNSDFAATMYESDPIVAALNKVPGFDPLKLMNRRRNPGAEKNERDLDFRYKKLWFRLAHRQGRICLNKLNVTEQLAIFEAQVYLELTDANPISSFTATCTREEAGSRYIEGAQIKAMDQALTDAGFGLQFVPAPIGGVENTTMQAAASPAANVRMSGMASKAVQAAAGTGNAQVSVATPRKVQQTVQQAAAQQRTAASQAAVQQRTAAPQQAVQRPASAPQQRPMTQQTAVQQKPAAAQSVARQPVVPQATVQQSPATTKPVAPQTRVQQGQTAPQPASQQRPAAAKPAAPQSAAPAKSAQTVQTAQDGQKETPMPAQAPIGMQKAAVNPAASASSQKPAAAAAPTPQPATGLPAGAEALSAEQPPVTAQEQTQPITSDVAAAISMLSGKKEPDTLPIAPEGTKEKAETIPEELPAAPTAAISAAPAAPAPATATPAALASTAPAANAPAASADQTAKEDKPYTEATPVEEIIKSMTLEDAKKVVVPSGTCRGWTVAEVAERRRPSLKFYLSEGYQGRDNILRAAARIVLDDLEKMAG